jgi:intein/homing endonuclease
MNSVLKGYNTINKTLNENDLFELQETIDILNRNNFWKNTKYEVLTPNGYLPFDGLKQVKSDLYKFYLEDGKVLEATLDHIVETKQGDLSIIDCYNNNLELKTLEGFTKINKIEKIGLDYVYDLVNVKDIHKYYTNNIVSHNCCVSGDTFVQIQTKDGVVFKTRIDELERFIL